MTTRLKARKFRLRKSSSLIGGSKPDAAANENAGQLASTAAVASAGAAAGGARAVAGGAPQFDADTAFAPDDDDDGFGDASYPTAGASRNAGATPSPAADANLADPAQVKAETDLDAIRREGLTGRQLRMARRVATKHGLAPTSDFDAVRLLRLQGIDPFEPSAMLQLVASDGQPTASGGSRALTRTEPPKLPQTTRRDAQLPSTEVMSEDMRAREIYKIQQDIARRRRRKSLMLLARLAFFVLLPTIVAGYYYYAIATPLYATKAEFLIQKADAPGGSMLSNLFSGTSFATTQDAITVQAYLQSREAMERLDKEVGFKKVFSDPGVDPIKRLPPDASNEQAYKVYRNKVLIGYDPSEGIIKLEVRAPDAETSRKFSLALISYAEEQVDDLSKRLREDQMQGARDSYDDAERKVEDAQAKVLDLQEKLGVLDPTSENAALMSQITSFETELQKRQLELQQLLDNAQPNQARVDGVKGDISRLQAVVTKLRSQQTNSGGSTASLAKISGELRMAESDLQTRTLMMQQALTQLETARIEANKQVRYLAMGVSPVAPDQATYPRKFENTLLAFLIFAGIYLMMSLTASILREQVSA